MEAERNANKYKQVEYMQQFVGEDFEAVISGVGTPLLLQLKICAVAGVVATSPLWLYEIWAFIVPGLHSQEKRWTRLFAVVAGPLFIAGVAMGYYVLPKGIATLIGFTPECSPETCSTSNPSSMPPMISSCERVPGTSWSARHPAPGLPAYPPRSPGARSPSSRATRRPRSGRRAPRRARAPGPDRPPTRRPARRAAPARSTRCG